MALTSGSLNIKGKDEDKCDSLFANNCSSTSYNKTYSNNLEAGAVEPHSPVDILELFQCMKGCCKGRRVSSVAVIRRDAAFVYVCVYMYSVCFRMEKN